MVKQKQRHVPSVGGKNKKIQGVCEVDPLDHGDWTLVKKQRITILIPPLPSKMQCTSPIAGGDELQEVPRKTNSHSHCPTLTPSPKQLVHQTEKSMALSPEHTIQSTKTVHPPEPTLTPQKPLIPSPRISLDDSPLHRFGDDSNRGFMMYDLSKFLPNQRMRASYLEKKLKKAGGLENWLVSLGLSRFISIFQGKCVGKFHLANLDMKKLKDMGTDAVGPRRKLLHAIECLCEPHCFLNA
ncbi:hypothetical protein F511_22183 [Dorcoceras hygrometricum]|uniref:SAM domain-containing protein n=1 Tax=Dorcoceras hygrometricum TaxID=472368 RepID=A0A2Z7BS19_9LAMI|nr:hypothetical protein F511_22183 [Dorcoceras hygrometricum]